MTMQIPPYVVSKLLPGPRAPERSALSARIGPRLEQYVQTIIPNMTALADEGSYFTSTTPTPGTAVNYSITAAFSDTAALLTLRNADGANGKNVVLDYIRIIAGATVPATATSGHFAIKLDAGSRGSAGTVLSPVNPNMDVGSGSVADLRFTPTVAAVTAASRLISRGVMRSVIPVANDEWLFTFGSVEKTGGTSLGGAVAQRMVIPVPPVILGPGANETLLLHVWFPGNATTAGQFECEVGWWER